LLAGHLELLFGWRIFQALTSPHMKANKGYFALAIAKNSFLEMTKQSSGRCKADAEED
jgi:hypothetical protein